MQTIRFDKMQGTGNDYIYIDARHICIEEPNTLAIKMSHRHFGVGSDGLVLIMNSSIADFRMRMFNADGSESGMCGNASRCVGKYLYEKGITDKRAISLETDSGVKTLWLEVVLDRITKVSVGMEAPKLAAHEIPILHPHPTHVPLEGFTFTCLSMGNPHAVTFVPDVHAVNVSALGRTIEHSPLFPERTNVEFAQIIAPDRIRMRVWERGSGETLACGTGACATLVAAVLRGLAHRHATIELLGGEVEVEWNEQTNDVTLTGEAEWVYNGEYNI